MYAFICGNKSLQYHLQPICTLFWIAILAKKKKSTNFSWFSLSFNRDCAKLLVGFHSAAAESKLKVVYGKYSSSDRGAVALFTPPKSLLARST